jgi:hypothetical protein
MDAMAWNYLQIETEGTLLRPTVGPGGMSRAAAHARVRVFLSLHAERVPDTAVLLDAWDAGVPDDTVYVGSLLWCIYEADDPATGAREWVDDLAASLRRTGSKVRVRW